MSFLLKQWSTLAQHVRQRLPDHQAALVPGNVFFCRKIELPENLAWSETQAYLELALESNAPFPIEQLAWGFLYDPGSAFAFVYATPKGRLKNLGFELPGNSVQIFPGFVSIFGPTVSEPTLRFVSQNGILSACFLEAKNPVPSKVISLPIRDELLTDDALIAARKSFLESNEESSYAPEDGLWHGEGIQLSADNVPAFTLRHVSDATPKPLWKNSLEVSSDTLWAADLRDANFAASEKTKRQRSCWVWNSLRIAAIAVVALLVGQAAVLGLNAYDSMVQKDLRELEPQATRVENKLTLADRLTRSTEEDLRPFLLMEAINPSRPDSIYFNDVRSRAYNELEIEGQSAQGVSPVNAFADAIEKLQGVASVENNSRTRNNQTSFEFIITFDKLPEEPEGGFVIPDEDRSDSSDDTTNE